MLRFLWTCLFVLAAALTMLTLPARAAGRGDIVTTSDETDSERRERIRLELASAYFAQGQFPTALDEVKRALQANPSSVPAYNLRGLIYASMNEPGLAEDSLRRALQINSEDGDTLQNYGWILCSQRRYPEAMAQFDAALALPQWRDTAKTLLAKGVCQARAGDLEAAELTLIRSQQVDASNLTAALNLAEVLYRRGDLDKAQFHIRRVNAVTEQQTAASIWLALRIERKRGNTGGVDELGRRLRTRFAGSPPAMAYEQGQFDE